MKIILSDPPFRIAMITEKKNNIDNGISIMFYPRTNMPQEKGNYLDGDKDGEWFYWNTSGVLIKKEVWRKGKLLKRIKMK